MDTNNSIWIYNCDTLQEELLLKKDMIQQEIIDYGIISPSARYILLPIRKEKVYEKEKNRKFDYFFELDSSVLYGISI